MKMASENNAKTQPLNISDTQNMAENLLKMVKEGMGGVKKNPSDQALVIGLYGDLGSGKTTFMQFFGASLGIKEKILSPTFVIEKIYKIEHPDFDHLIHIDAYRLESPEEMSHLGWAEILNNPRNIICVEWADRIESILPTNTVKIQFSHHGEESRLISFEK